MKGSQASPRLQDIWGGDMYFCLWLFSGMDASAEDWKGNADLMQNVRQLMVRLGPDTSGC